MKERMKKLKELVTKSKKNLVITIGCTLLVICMVGGGIIYATQPAEQSVAAENVQKDEDDFTKTDISDVVAGIEDHYILQDAKNIDYSHGVTYDKDIVKDVKVESGKVDLSKPGDYKVTYTVKADKKALEEYLAEKAEAVNTAGENTASDTTDDAAQTETAIDDTAAAKTDNNVSEKKEEANKDSSSVSKKEEQKETSNDQKVESDKKQDAVKEEQKSDKAQEAAKKEESKQETGKNNNDKKNETDVEKSEVKENQKSDTKADTQKTDEKKETSSTKKKDDTVDIKVDTTITVVDKDKADELANKGEVVWKDNNETVPKTDGTVVEEKVETPPSTEEKPAETTGAADTKQPGKETSKQDTKPAASANQSTQESNPPKQTHTHNYNIPITKTVRHKASGHNEPVYKTVTDYQDQPVYETKVVCGCGAIFDNTQQWDQHSIDGCIYGYSVKRVQTGTQRVAVGTHQEQTGTRWVQDSAEWDETVTTGYKCSCGATK